MIWVAGGTGYTGGFLVRRLARTGHRFRCFVRRSSTASRILSTGADVVYGDLEDVSSIARTIEDATVVVSVAHIEFARNIVAACRGSDVQRGVFLSSTRRYSGYAARSVEEVVEGERGLEGCPFPLTVLRPTMVYGPEDDRNMAQLRAYLRRYRVIPIFGPGTYLQQPVYVEDVIDAILSVLADDRTMNREYTVAGPCPLTYNEVIDTISRALGIRSVKAHLPLGLSLLLARVYGKLWANPKIQVEQIQRLNEHKAFEIGPARADFGYDPISFEEGMRRTMAWRVNSL